MAPKPFPFPIGVGVDICRIDRIAAILREENTRNRWARRVFTRLEWPALMSKFKNANRVDRKPHKQEKNSPWMLPKLTAHSSILDNEDQTAFWSAIADDRSVLGRLARYLAGRWAVKEAVIKAHKYRYLYMQDISIIRQPQPNTVEKNLVALIDPVCDTVEFHARVATVRMLRGFGPGNSDLHKGPLGSTGRGKGKAELMAERMAAEGQADEFQTGMHVDRRRKINECDRQIAKVNISHNGEYAVAVCMAFDTPNHSAESNRMIDHGNGAPIHEPQWGDEGWLIREPMEGGKEWRHLSLDDLLDPPQTSTNTDTYECALKEEFEEEDGDDCLR